MEKIVCIVNLFSNSPVYKVSDNDQQLLGYSDVESLAAMIESGAYCYGIQDIAIECESKEFVNGLIENIYTCHSLRCGEEKELRIEVI